MFYCLKRFICANKRLFRRPISQAIRFGVDLTDESGNNRDISARVPQRASFSRSLRRDLISSRRRYINLKAKLYIP